MNEHVGKDLLARDRVARQKGKIMGLIAGNTNEMRARHIRSILVRQNPVEDTGHRHGYHVIRRRRISEVIFKGIAGAGAVKEMVRGLEH